MKNLCLINLGCPKNLVDGEVMLGRLAAAGFHLVAILVLLTGVLIPFFKLGLLFGTSASLHSGIRFPGLAWMFRSYRAMDEWGMLEVYMLGILIAVFKLQDLAAVSYGTGLFCFVILLVITLFSSAALDEDVFWHHIDQTRRRRRWQTVP